MKRYVPTLVLALALFGTAHGQTAQTTGQPQAAPAMGAPPPAPQGTFEENCGTDVQAYCANAVPGKRRTSCLLKSPKVSQACIVYLRRHHAQRMQQQMHSPQVESGPE